MQVQELLINDSKVLRVLDLLEPRKFASVSKFIQKQTFNSNGFMLDLDENYSTIDIVYQVILDAIKDALKHISVNGYPTGFCVSRNRGVDHWHVHVGEFKNDPNPIIPEKFYVALYYPHSFWDSQYGGNLLVGKSNGENMHSFPCIPNSCVIHSNLVGHDLDFLKLDESKSDRIVMYSHWIDK